MLIRKLALPFLAVSVIVLGAAFIGCDSSSNGGDVQVTIHLTDAPFPFDDAAEANVTVLRVELIGSDSVGGVVLVDSAQSFNLLELQDGVTAALASADIPAFDYSQLRIIVDEDASVLMKDSTLFDLKVPSGSQTGIKINLPDVDFSGAGDEVEITVDFDVSGSFVVRGSPKTVAEITGFLFKPVLKIASATVDGVPVELSSSGD